MFKKCIKCQIELELSTENFHSRKDSKDGYRNDCRKCFSARGKEYNAKNAERNRKRANDYAKANPERIKERGKEYREKNKEKLIEKYHGNKEYHQKQAKKYWAKNRERLIELNKQWKLENEDKVKSYKVRNADRNRQQERARYQTAEGRKKAQMIRNKYFSTKRLLRNDLTLEEWNQCLKFFSNECAYCGSKEGTLEQDHFIPLSRGGEFTKLNIVPACRSCNASKGNRMFSNWFKGRESYSYEREGKLIEYTQSKVGEENDSLQIFGYGNRKNTKDINNHNRQS